MDLHKTTLGRTNLKYLKTAQLSRPTLYIGDVVVNPLHTPHRVYDNEDTLVHAEVSRTKMLEKMKDPECPIISSPINYAKLNNLYDTFVPQKELTREHAYWLPANEVASNQSKPTQQFVHARPAKSQVNSHLKTLKSYFPEFDEVNPQQALKYKGMFDSGFSRHMTGNKALLTNYQDIDGGFVAFGGSTKGGNQANKNAGHQEVNGDTCLKKNVDVGHNEQEKVSTQQYIVFPLCSSFSSSYKSSYEKAGDNTADDVANKEKVQEPIRKANFNNMESFTVVSLIPTTRVHSNHPEAQIIGDSMSAVQTRDFAEHDFKEGTDALHASADLQAQSDPLGHLHEELNSATIKAQKQKMAEHEAKRQKMFDEYNHQITHRVLTQAKALGIPPPSEFSTFGLSVPVVNKKRKRSLEILKERGTPEAEEMIKKMELTIKARDDADHARLIVKDNLDGLG
nr:hypothetical protein [Tanacetum cinerariifolium]